MENLNNEAGASTSVAAINAAQGNASEKQAPVAASPKASKAKADNANAVPAETKLVRFPLAIFKDGKFLEKFPKGIQAKLNKVGITKAGGREWGPEIAVTDREAKIMFDIAQNIYRNVDSDADKNMKTFGYQLRNKIAEVFGYHVDVRHYQRKPKEAPVVEQPAAAPVAAAPVVQEEPMQMAASMPPRANIDRANQSLTLALTILEENGQTGVANLVRAAQTEITIEA